MDYKTFVYLTSGTGCHVINLISPDGDKCLGVYNGYSYWGRVFAFNNELDAYDGVDEIDIFYAEEGNNFHPDQFEDAGYVIGRCWLHQCK